MLDVKNLSVNISEDDNSYEVLSDVSFSVDKNQTLGLVGESGCGKSITATAIMGFLRKHIKITSGSILFEGKDLVKYTEKEYENIRGTKISIIFQDSIASLNPLMKIGKQIEEVYKLHYKMSRKELKLKVEESLVNVGFTNPKQTVNKYPHHLSGGQRQRVMIAMAIVCNPDLLIADEPTTALDVTTQNKILGLIRKIQNKYDMGVILISHDITVINRLCTHVGVMYAGKIVEYGDVKKVIKEPKHPYTKALINSIPSAENKNKKLNVIGGSVPNLDERNTTGCIFYDRCKFRSEECKQNIKNIELDDGRKINCNLYY